MRVDSVSSQKRSVCVLSMADLFDFVGDDLDEDRFVINVGGQRHETLTSTLLLYPDTKLYNIAKNHQVTKRPEYYFDRHPGVFNCIIDYYRTGQLHVPLDICGAVVKQELEYWHIDDCKIEACCWTNYSGYLDNQKTLSSFNQSLTDERNELEHLESHTEGWKKFQIKLWMVLDHPHSSNLALAYAITSFVFVLASITGYCLETLPSMGTYRNVTQNVTLACYGDEDKIITIKEPHKLLTTLDLICTGFFTIELVTRLVFAPDKTKFIKSIMNVIDIMALLPLYVQVVINNTDPLSCLRNHHAVLEILFILRIIRIFRIFHLVKHYGALKILIHAIIASYKELLMLSIFLMIAMLIFSTLIFYAERPREGDLDREFETIPIGFWWSIITMTTVGYGDLYPSTTLGFIIGCLCALCGVLLIALTIPVISNNFALFYMHARTREILAKKTDRTRDRMQMLQAELEANDQCEMDCNDVKSAIDSRTHLLRSIDSNSTDSEAIVLASRDHDNGECVIVPNMKKNPTSKESISETAM